MTMGAGDVIRLALVELEELLESRAPGIRAGLLPGLSEDEIDRLQAPLAPYVLPFDLRVLYGWHNGHDPMSSGEYDPAFAAGPFPPLAEAVANYQGWREDVDHWNPLWFPAFGENSGALVTLGTDAARSAGTLWDFHSHDADIDASYDSILSMIDTTAAMWRLAQTGRSVAIPAALRHQHNPMSIGPDGRSVRVLSKYGTQGWPDDWLEAAGVGAMVPDADDLVMTVGEFLATPRFDRTLRGTLHVRSGSDDWAYASLADETGSVDVLLMADRTENFREVAGGMSAEVRLASLPDDAPTHPSGDAVREAVDPRIRDLYPSQIFENFERHFTADFLVTRLIPL